MLHTELKELQDRVNDQNVRNSMVDSKNADLCENYDRVLNENNENIFRLKKENERLGIENRDLLNKTSDLHKELDHFHQNLDEQTKTLSYQRGKAEQEIHETKERISISQNRNAEFENELKATCRVK